MIEYGALPGSGVVTRFAVGREAGRRVVGIGGGIVVRQVARVAFVGDAGMVKNRAAPGSCAVACFTAGGKTQRHMVGVRRRLEV